MPGAAFSAITTAVANAAVLAGVTSGLAAVVLGNIVAIAFFVGTTFALGAVSKALTPKPGRQSFTSALSARTQTVKQPISNHLVIYGKVRVAGVVTFLQTTFSGGLFHMVSTIAGHSIKSIDEYWFDDELLGLTGTGLVNTGPRASFARVVAGLGTTATDLDFNTAMIANVPSFWTTNHKQAGRAKVYIEGLSSQFPNGVPNATFIVQGNNTIYDPRDLSTGYTNNAALCIRDYLINTSYGLGESTGRIDDTAFIAAANISDETITLTTGATEPRYTINGTIDTGRNPKDVIQEMLAACAGTLTYQGGKWALYVGAYRTPTITFDEDVLDGPISVQTRIGRKEIFNRVKGVFVNPGDFYNPTDFPIVTNATYLTEDNNEEIFKDISLAFTTSSATAQRLAKIELEKARQQITVNYPVNLNGLRVQIGDVVNLTNTRMGWTTKPFEVTDWAFANRGGQDSPRLGIDLVLRETASTVYDWADGEETTLDPAPNTNLINPLTIGNLSVPSISESLFSTKEAGGVKAKATVSWSETENGFVNSYRVAYKLSTDSTFLIQPEVNATSYDILDIAPGVYDFKYTAITDSRTEKESATVTKEIFGLSIPPQDVTGLSISPISGLAVLVWTQHPDLDVRQGGTIVFRHSSALTGATWGASVSIGQAIPGSANSVTLPLVEGTYLVKAIDSSGIFSTGAALISTKSPTHFTFTNLSTLAYAPDFSGTDSNTVSVDSILKLAGAANIDTWGTIDSINDWDNEGGISLTGTKTFTAGIDLGSVKTVRMTAAISAITNNIADLIDSRTTNMDLWESFDGTTGAQTDIQLFVRETDDDPSGSPTWETWKILSIADYTARAFQFKADLSTNDPTFNIEISTLTITADEVV